MKSILDYSVEVDEADDAKKEEKKSWTFKKVNKWDGNGLDIEYDREIICFMKMQDHCNKIGKSSVIMNQFM